MRNFFIFAMLVGLSCNWAVAKSMPSVQAVIESAFKDVKSIEVKSIILSSDQVKKIRNAAKAQLDTKVYRYYNIIGNTGSLGKGILITRCVLRS